MLIEGSQPVSFVDRRADARKGDTAARQDACPQLRHSQLILPLLALGAGAADAFAFLVLGGTFTANMTGNAVIAGLFNKPDYLSVAVGAIAALAGFMVAIVCGLKATRGAAQAGNTARAYVIALSLAMAAQLIVVMLWMSQAAGDGSRLSMIFASAAGMAFQTIAAKRDHVDHGTTTTYSTGTLVDLLIDVTDGRAPLRTSRWCPLIALPLGAASVATCSYVAPGLAPIIPLVTTILAMMIILGSSDRRRWNIDPPSNPPGVVMPGQRSQTASISGT